MRSSVTEATYITRVHMTNESHDIRDFFGRHNVAIATLFDELGVDVVLFRCQNGGLMKTDTRGMYIHV